MRAVMRASYMRARHTRSSERAATARLARVKFARESVADVETYLNSDFWSKCETETKWTDVVGEVFEIV